MSLIRAKSLSRTFPGGLTRRNTAPRSLRQYGRFHLLETLEGRQMAAADTMAMLLSETDQSADIAIGLVHSGAGARPNQADQASLHAATEMSAANVDQAWAQETTLTSPAMNPDAANTDSFNANGFPTFEWTDPRELREALDVLRQSHNASSEAIEQEAQVREQAVLDAAEQQKAQLHESEQAQLREADQDHAVAVAEANRRAEMERVAAEQVRAATVAAAQREAAHKIDAEAANRDAEINRQLREADRQLGNEARSRDAAIAQHQSNASRQVTAAEQNAARQSAQAIANRDAEIRDARSWADRAIAKLPRWARGLASYLRPILNTVESTINRVTAAAQKTIRQIQSQLQAATQSILQARDRLVASVRNAYESAVRGILSTRDRLVTAARNTYNHASSALIATRDRTIRAANETAASIQAGIERTRTLAVTNVGNALQSAKTLIIENRQVSLSNLRARVQEAISEVVNDKVTKANDLWVTTRNEVTRVGGGIVTHGVRTVQVLGTFAKGTADSFTRSGSEFLERLQSAKSLRDVGVATWVFGRDLTTSVTQQAASASMQHVFNGLMNYATTIVDAIVPDTVMREMMHAKLSWYADKHAEPTATVNAQFGGAPLYYINGIETGLQGQNYLAADQNLADDHGAMEQAESLSFRLGRAIHVVWNRTDGKLHDLAESLADRLWHPILPQHNAATKALAGMLLRHAQNYEPVSLVAHSQGNIIVRNALRTLYHLGYENWVRDHVTWVGAGSPVSHADVEFSVRYTRIVHDGDPINVVADYQQFRETGRSGRPVGFEEHSMLLAYMPQIKPSQLWTAGNHQVGNMPEAADPIRFALHESLWTAREARGITPYITHQMQVFA